MTEEIKVEKGIPLPISFQAQRYPFDKMDIGDSFFIEKVEAQRLSAAASLYGKRNNMKFSVRSIDNGYRCWRVK